MNILFVCNQGKHRSRTAAKFYSQDHTTRSAGIYTNLQKQDLEWADLIVVMEEHQRSFIAEEFPNLYLKKRIVCLDIPDVYSYKQPKLVEKLTENFLTTV